MEVRILAETYLSLEETKVLFRLLGEMSGTEYRRKGFTEDEITLTSTMFDDLDKALGDES